MVQITMKLSNHEESAQNRCCNNTKTNKAIKTMLDSYSKSLKQLSKRENLEDLVLKFREKDKKIEELQTENQSMLTELRACENYITNQIAEMKKVANYIDSLAQGSERENGGEKSEKAKRQKSCKCTKVLQSKIDTYKTKLMKELQNNKVLSEQMKKEKQMRNKTEEVLAKTRQMYDDLLEENQRLRHECEMHKSVNPAQIKQEMLEEFEQERNSFIEELEESRLYIKEQCNKINSLQQELEVLHQEDAQRKEALNLTISNMQDVENELESSRQQFAFERTCLCSRIDELQNQVNDYQSRIIQNNENNKVLLDAIEREKTVTAKLANGIKTMAKSDESLKEMLSQAKCTIKCITQQLEEYDIERLEAQKHNEIKVSELQDRLMIADTTIKKLRENMDKMKNLMDKNIAMRTLSAQLHESVNLQLTELQDTNQELWKKNKNVAEMYDYLKQVLYEKDKTFDDFRNQMLALKQELENEQKLREDTELALADAAAAGDSELAELKSVITAQDTRIKQLNSTIQELQRTTAVGRLKTYIKKLEVENKDLRREVQKFVAYLKVILPGYTDPEEVARLKEKIGKLTDELNQQRREVERQKQMQMDIGIQMNAKLEEQNELSQRVRDLIRENAELKRKRYRNSSGTSPAVILVQKESGENGEPEYRCLLGEKKTSDDVHPDEAVKRKLGAAEEEINRLKQQLANNNSSGVPVSSDRNVEDSRKIAQLEQDLKSVTQELAAARREHPAEIQKLKQNLKTATEEIAVLKEKLAKQEVPREDTTKLKEDLKSAVDENTVLKEKLAKAETSQGQKKSEDPKLKEDLKSALEENAILRDKLAIAETGKTEAESEKIKQLREALESIAEENRILKEQISNPKTVTPEKQKEETDQVKEHLVSIIIQENKILKEKLALVENEMAELEKEGTVQLKEDLKSAVQEIMILKDKLMGSGHGGKETEDIIAHLKEELKTAIKELKEQLASPTPVETPHIELQKPETTDDRTCQEERKKLLEEIAAQKTEISNLIDKINQSYTPTGETDPAELILKENENLKKRIEELENPQETSDDLQKSYGALKQMFDMETAHVENLEKICKQHEDDAESLKLKIEELEKENSELKKDNEDLKNTGPSNNFREEMDTIGTDLQNWKQKIQKALEDINAIMRGVSDNVANSQDPNSVSELLEKVDKLRKSLEEAIARKSVTIKTDIKKSLLDELQQQLADRTDEIATLKNQIKDLQETRGNDTTAPGEDMKELQKKIRLLERSNDRLQAEVNRLRYQRQSALSLETSDENVGKVDEGDPNAQLVEELEQRLVEMQRNYDTDIGKLKAKIDLLSQSQPQEQTAAMMNLSKDLENGQETIKNLEKTIANLEDENRRLVKSQFGNIEKNAENEKIMDLVEHLRTLEKKNEGLKNRIVQLELDNNRLRADLDSLAADKDGQSYQQAMQKLRDAERSSEKCHEKYQVLKKRSIKLEIENKNLKKEYINILIEKEKILLMSQEQTRRLRETNKLLRKAQEKRASLTDRTVRLQVENDSLKRQLDSVINKELEDHLEKLKPGNTELTTLKEENKRLHDLVQELSYTAGINEVVLPQELVEFLRSPKEEGLKFKIVQLELANEKLTEELQKLKSARMQSEDNDLIEQRVAEELSDLQDRQSFQKVRMDAVELEVQNEYLKHELAVKDKALQDCKLKEDQIKELEEANHDLQITNENLQRVTVDLELDNEFLKKELERIDDAQGTSNYASKTLEKQNHALKMKIDQLDGEAKKLKDQIDEMGKIQITLEAHTQQNLIDQIDRLLNDYENAKSGGTTQKSKNNDLRSVEERLSSWKNEFEPKLQGLKQNLDQLTEKLDGDLPAKLQQVMEKNEQLKIDKENLTKALQTLLSDRENPKILAQVEEQLRHYASNPPENRDEAIKELDEQLEKCKNVNKLLRDEKISLESHVQSQKINELEEIIRRKGLADDNEIPQISRTKSIFDNVDLIKIKHLEEQLQELEDKHARTVDEVEKLRITNNELNSRIKVLEKLNDQVNVENDRLKKINQLNNKLKSDLEQQLQEMRYDVTKELLKDKSNDQVVTFINAEDDMAKIKREYLKLHERYENNLKRIADLEDQLRNCQEKNKEFKRKLGLPVTQSRTSEDSALKKKRSKSEDNEAYSKGNKSNLQDAETDELEKNTDNELVEAQNKIEVLKGDLTRLHQANILLRGDAEKVPALEERLLESDINLKTALDEIKRLHNDKVSLENRRYEVRLTEVENELKERQRVADIYKEKLQSLENPDDYIEENKYLKEEINSLVFKLNAYENETNILKKEIHRLALIKEDLLEQNNDYKNELTILRNHIKLLGGGENAFFEELEAKEKEIGKLKLVIGNLQKRIDSSRVECEGGKGDVDEERANLEETLWKYRDNNEFLKKKISQLETEKVSLIMNLNAYPGGENEEKPTIVFEVSQDTIKEPNKTISTSTSDVRSHGQETRLEEVKKEVEQWQNENKNLKAVTVRLETEIMSLKKDLNVLMTKERKKKGGKNAPIAQNKQEKSAKKKENEEQQKRNWKNVVSRLVEQYQDNINSLKRKLQPMPPILGSPGNNVFQPWMIQPTVLPPGYTTMPLLVQPMPNYDLNKDLKKTSTNSGDGIQKLNKIVDQIKGTLETSKQECKDENEEREEMLLDYDSFIVNAQSQIDSSSVDVDEKIAELDKQIIKQHQNKEKIDKLQRDIQKTMRNLKALSQRPNKTTEIPGPSTTQDSQCGLKNNRCPSLKPHCHFAPGAQIINEENCSSVRFSEKKQENDSFDSL